MNMNEIETIETRIPVGMRLEINQMHRDLLVARAKRDRSEYIAATLRKVARSVRSLFAQAGGVAATASAAQLHRQHQHQ